MKWTIIYSTRVWRIVLGVNKIQGNDPRARNIDSKSDSDKGMLRISRSDALADCRSNVGDRGIYLTSVSFRRRRLARNS